MIDYTLTIYTDGSCSPNPGIGGWGFISILPDVEFHINGGKEYTTNNQMELQAVIEALSFHSEESSFLIYSDSMYVINCAQGKWARKKNSDLWVVYEEVSLGKNIEYVWVKGHFGDEYNEKVDKLAKAGSRKIK